MWPPSTGIYFSHWLYTSIGIYMSIRCAKYLVHITAAITRLPTNPDRSTNHAGLVNVKAFETNLFIYKTIQTLTNVFRLTLFALSPLSLCLTLFDLSSSSLRLTLFDLSPSSLCLTLFDLSSPSLRTSEGVFKWSLFCWSRRSICPVIYQICFPTIFYRGCDSFGIKTFKYGTFFINF